MNDSGVTQKGEARFNGRFLGGRLTENRVRNTLSDPFERNVKKTMMSYQLKTSGNVVNDSPENQQMHLYDYNTYLCLCCQSLEPSVIINDILHVI